MKAKYIGLMLLLVLVETVAFGQVPRKYVRSGNSKFNEGNFSDAEVDYRKAVAKNPDYYKGQFNLGDAMYEQKNMEESGKIFNRLTETTKDPKVKSSALYNYGNTLLNQKKYKEAMEAYKKSLLLNPTDQNAKYNYEYARKKMIQQQKQQKQQQKNKDKNKNKNKDKNKDQNKDKNKDKQKQDKKDQNKDKNDQQQKPQDKKDQQQKQSQNKDEQGKKGDQQKQQQQAKPQQMSKKDAQRMLNALKNDEKKTLHKLQRKKAKAGRAKKSDIDW